MWADGRIDFLSPVPLGSATRRRSTIADAAKTGRTGPMVFVTVLHEIFVGATLAIREEHDLVFREAAAPQPRAPEAPPAPADFRRTVAPGPVELFRYSALTYNGHRVHHGRGYATKQEGYPGLVVLSPPIATLLVDDAQRWRPRAAIPRFAYRARSPLFDGTGFDLCAAATDGGARVGAEAPGGGLAMEGELSF